MGGWEEGKQATCEKEREKRRFGEKLALVEKESWMTAYGREKRSKAQHQRLSGWERWLNCALSVFPATIHIFFGHIMGWSAVKRNKKKNNNTQVGLCNRARHRAGNTKSTATAERGPPSLGLVNGRDARKHNRLVFSCS